MKAEKRKIIGYVALAVSVGAIAYILSNKKKNEKIIQEINDILDGTKPDPQKKQMGGQVVIQKSVYDKLPAGSFPLAIGQKNKKIYDLQKLLNDNYGSNLDLDGKFGQGMYSVLCDKFWKFCGASIGIYKRTISQSDFDEIRALKR